MPKRRTDRDLVAIGANQAVEALGREVDELKAEVERLHRLETAVRHYHEGHGYIERSQRWQAVRALLEVQQKGGEG